MSIQTNEEFYIDWSQAVSPEDSKIPTTDIQNNFLLVRDKEGLCLNSDPKLFFPDQLSSSEVLPIAKAVCERCVIKVECLEYAIQARERHGIWGGSSERERRRIIRERKLAGLAIAESDN